MFRIVVSRLRHLRSKLSTALQERRNGFAEESTRLVWIWVAAQSGRSRLTNDPLPMKRLLHFSIDYSEGVADHATARVLK